MKKISILMALLAVCLAAPLFAVNDYDLLVAAVKGDTATIRALVNAGANVNAKGKDGYTALMYAASWENADTVKALLDAGASVNAKISGSYKNGYTALSLAMENGHTATANALRAAGGQAP